MESTSRIYLDYAATTPLAPAALVAMAPWLDEFCGNPSSLYAEGRKAKAAIDAAREKVSSALGSMFAEVIFTSGGTEAANLAIVGAALGNQDHRRKRILMGAAEHHCVLSTQPILEKMGYQVQYLKVDNIARIRMDELEYLLGPDVLLVSFMHANNELGTLQPAMEIGRRARAAGALYHCDAVQTFLGWQWTPEKILADLVSVSAHKIGGPKGVGALYIRAGVKLKPFICGGGQEREMRPGTENVAGIVGFASAVDSVVKGGLAPRSEKRRAARDAFIGAIDRRLFVETVSDRLDLLPGHAHLRMEGIEAETMLILLDRMGLSASSGAACSSGSLEPSHVLIACGYAPQQARKGLRFTFSDSTTTDEAKRAAAMINEAANQIADQRKTIV